MDTLTPRAALDLRPESPIVRIDDKPFTLEDLADLYAAARMVIDSVSPKARRSSGTHYVSGRRLERLAGAIKSPW